MSGSKKYFNERLCMGGDCTARMQKFIFDGAAVHVVSLFNKEQFAKVIKALKSHKGISGIRGLISKVDVINILNNISKETFEP